MSEQEAPPVGALGASLVAEPTAPVVRVPPDGTPPIVDSPGLLAQAAASLAQGTGPIAVDAERASGFRYSQRAYLLQLRRAGSGTHLIDPIPFGEQGLAPLADVVTGEEWILHAASQDLACLAELGLWPGRLFDTELAGRILGRARVSLAAMVEDYFQLALAKEFQASDWSIRPIPARAADYAALDVQWLLPLREILEGELAAAGKLTWALEEFEAARLLPPPAPRTEPWRRTHRIGDVRTQRGLAVVRELWLLRDAIARERDTAPGKLLNDRALAALASRDPLPPRLPDTRDFRKLDAVAFAKAYDRALRLPSLELPAWRAPSRGGLPDVRNWPRVNPPAAKRWGALRPAVLALAKEIAVPQEILLSPQVQRRVAWEVSLPKASEVEAVLRAAEARNWQVELLTPVIVDALLARGL